MVQTTIYPLRERAKAFCRGFKTFHPLVEVAKEGLTRKGLDPKLKEEYKKRVVFASPSDKELLERRKERLFHSKLIFIAACALSIAIGFDAKAIFESDAVTLKFSLAIMGSALMIFSSRLAENALKQSQSLFHDKLLFKRFGVYFCFLFASTAFFNDWNDLTTRLKIFCSAALVGALILTYRVLGGEKIKDPQLEKPQDRKATESLS